MSPHTAREGLATEPLGKHHNRAAFSCGVPELDTYLRKQARPDARRNIAAPFVIGEPGTSNVIGYYTLSATSTELGELPRETARKRPHYPDGPAFLLARLAVDSAHRGEGLGKRLLLDALRRCWEQNAHVAAALVIVGARDEAAARFYEHFGFQRLSDRPDRLFIPMRTVAAVFG